jgi:hypothetical protein
MAGYKPLLAKTTPDQFKTWDHIYHTAPTAAGATYPVFYCERSVIIDEVIVMTYAASASMTVNIVKCATIAGTSPTSILTTPITTAAQGLSFGVIDTTANLVPGPTGVSLTDGNLVFLTLAGTNTGWVGSITIRYRTRLG